MTVSKNNKKPDKNTIIWKRWRTGNRFLDRILVVILIAIMLLGVYTIYDSLYLLGVSPVNMAYYFEGGKEEWDKMPDEAIAWLTIYDSHINYPIVQGEDNDEYLNKDAHGNFALVGSIFLDFRNDPGWKDDYNLLYGHHMSSNVMFGSLDLFMDEEYFNAHREGILKTRAADYKLETFAVIEDQASNEYIFNAGSDARSSKEIIDYLRKNSLIFKEPSTEKLISFTTCQTTGSTERLIVVATMTVDREPGTIYDPGELIEPSTKKPDESDTSGSGNRGLNLLR